MSDTPELDKMAAALRDAERYRWWRDKVIAEDFDVLTLTAADNFIGTYEFDAAVDRAMAEATTDE